MVFRKRYGKRKRFARRKKMPMLRKPSVYQKPVYIKRNCVLTTTTINNQFTGNGISFKISDLPNVSDITNLFDYYKIVGVKLKWIYTHNSSEAGAVGYGLPNLVYTIDYDDANLPANEDALLERNTTRIKRMDKPITLYLKPKINNEIYNNGVVSGYALSKGQVPYIDTSNASVSHFGVKYGIVLNAAQTGNGIMKLYATYYLKCLHSV